MLQDERMKSLPVPTPEQTAQFADHVADNHSWYKHLPFFPPGASFVFYPNPHAGRGVTGDGDRFAVYDIERGDYFAHHSRLSTADYRAQFGHWDYWVDDNPRVPFPLPGPWLYSADGGRPELLADEFKRQWSCRLTAFLKLSPDMFMLRASELGREAEAFMASGRRRLGDRQPDVFGGRDRELAEDPAVARYCAVANRLRRVAETRDPAWPHFMTSEKSGPTLSQFMESEAEAQRQTVLDTLRRVWAAWSVSQCGGA